MPAAPPDVVLSDLKMPGLDGIAFLKRVRALSADAVLLLLTGYADKESAIAAINDVGIWQYVEKPWDTADLILKVRQGLERRDLVARLEASNRQLSQRVSELEAARERLLVSERLAAVGRVMAGLAHEMGNQLGLMGYAQLILDKTRDAELTDYAEAILRAQRRLGGMISEIKDFVRSPDGPRDAVAIPREPDDLAAVVEEAVALVRFDREVQGREVRLAVQARPTVRLHRGKVMQAVINLAKNAAQASADGLPIEVSVEREGGEAVVRVVDRGSGMAPEVLARLGEPFFTTKEGGTGLGLGITRRIVEDHGGSLRIDSRPGAGTRVEVRLPLVPLPEAQAEAV
jgi:two-component system NtrC family sensor kinase